MKLVPLLAAVLVAGTAAATALPAQTRITPGQTLRGALTATDATMGDGSHFDLYTFAGRAGQTVTVTLRSEAFDAYLAVGRMAGGEFESIETDDDGAGGTDARVTLTLGEAGSYAIRANSLSEGETGDYTLTLETGAAAPVTSPSGGGGIVSVLLDSATVMMRNGGMAPRGEVLRGSLAPGASTDLSVQVAAGATLAFVGVCDASCSDLDLTVFGPDGQELGSDVLDDDAPIVALQNPRAGTYRVRVSMPGCSAARCGFGVRAFGT